MATYTDEQLEEELKTRQVAKINDRLNQRNDAKRLVLEKFKANEDQIKILLAEQEQLRDARNQIEGTVFELQNQLQELTGETPMPVVQEPENRQQRRQKQRLNSKQKKEEDEAIVHIVPSESKEA